MLRIRSLTSYQTLTEPILFHTIHLRNSLSLLYFYDSLTIQVRRPGDTVGHLVKHPCVSLPKSLMHNDRAWNCLFCLFFLVPRLQAFELLECPALPCYLRCLGQFALSTLAYLNIIICESQITTF
jgi:hypothetical protein